MSQVRVLPPLPTSSTARRRRPASGRAHRRPGIRASRIREWGIGPMPPRPIAPAEARPQSVVLVSPASRAASRERRAAAVRRRFSPCSLVAALVVEDPTGEHDELLSGRLERGIPPRLNQDFPTRLPDARIVPATELDRRPDRRLIRRGVPRANLRRCHHERDASSVAPTRMLSVISTPRQRAALLCLPA